MLTYDLKAKVTEFELSFRIEDDDQVWGSKVSRANRLGVLAPRWAAYEVMLGYASILEKSDVWSYGIFMWELFHLGNVEPYANITDSNSYPEISLFLKNGQRLEKPPLCPQSLYKLMCWCWNQHYQFRPTFFEIKGDLEKFQPKQYSEGECQEEKQ